nr:hypothetical protein CFP56_11461 [Quercus suber]
MLTDVSLWPSVTVPLRSRTLVANMGGAMPPVKLCSPPLPASASSYPCKVPNGPSADYQASCRHLENGTTSHGDHVACGSSRHLQKFAFWAISIIRIVLAVPLHDRVHRSACVVVGSMIWISYLCPSTHGGHASSVRTRLNDSSLALASPISRNRRISRHTSPQYIHWSLRFALTLPKNFCPFRPH